MRKEAEIPAWLTLLLAAACGLIAANIYYAQLLAGPTVAAPVAGRAADRGWTRSATWLAMLAVAGSFLLSTLGLSGSRVGLFSLVLAAVLLDFGVTANGVLGQRAIYALDPAVRGRLNGLYMATFFGGGALGSALGGWAYAQGGWALATGAGLVLSALALACFFTETRSNSQ